MKHRRWPYITSVLIVVNVLFFLMTHERLRREANQYAEIESRTLSLAAVHPKAPVTTAQQDLIDSFRNQHAKDWELMASLHEASADLDEMPDELKELAQELDDFQRDSITARFAVYPPHRSLLSTLTANFLHRSWAQLVFNICFLWLVGGTLEDVWGRTIYSCIWLVSGILGVWSYTLAYRAGLAPLVGASCLIAVLMGFYVIRSRRLQSSTGRDLGLSTAFTSIQFARLHHFSNVDYGTYFFGKVGGRNQS